MVKYIAIILLFLAGCRTSKTVTKDSLKQTTTEKKDSSSIVKRDSLAVHNDTSRYETEYTLDFGTDTGTVRTTYVSDSLYFPVIRTGQPLTRITIKTNARIAIRDSTITHSVDSGNVVTNKTNSVTKTEFTKTKKTSFSYWWLLLLLPILYAAYRKLKYGKIFPVSFLPF